MGLVLYLQIKLHKLNSVSIDLQVHKNVIKFFYCCSTRKFELVVCRVCSCHTVFMAFHMQAFTFYNDFHSHLYGSSVNTDIQG